MAKREKGNADGAHANQTKKVVQQGTKVSAQGEVTPLTKAEKAALEKYEKEVDEHKVSFIAMAVALSLIQRNKLYRGQGTFAEYCEARFDIKRAYAYKLIRAGEIQDELKELGAPEVSNESQARLLGTIIAKEE